MSVDSTRLIINHELFKLFDSILFLTYLNKSSVIFNISLMPYGRGAIVIPLFQLFKLPPYIRTNRSMTVFIFSLL
jgi:hypothetical protein